MATYAVKNLTFTYPGKTEPALKDVTLNIEMGEFIAVCGQSGSGKSTLLRNLKPILAPHGDRQGDILFYGEPIENMSQQRQAARIGYVLQNPDNQIVTDKVWHELAFGLESLGLDTKTIRLRVAEMASFFGIQSWFHKDVDQLSGGQRQLLNLAAVMVMQPDVLILDEPTSQLDPIAAGDFLETVGKINRELGTTVIITEHRLEDVLPMADRAIVLDKGKVIADDIPANVGAILAKGNHPMFMAMPTPLQAYAILYQEGIGKNLACPVNVREGRNWLTDLLRGEELVKIKLPADEEKEPAEDPVIEMKDVWFRYERSEPDVVKDLSLKVYPGEMFCLVGGNGTGKTTTLTLASGIRRPYRGTVKLKGKAIDKYKKNEMFDGVLGVLPQNPQSIFVEKTVKKDLLEIFEGRDLNEEEKYAKVRAAAEMVEIGHLLDMHPYDLSGGEQQRAALAKVLLLEPEILLLDEPTKGLDSSFKAKLADVLKGLQAKGMTILMVSHDVEFCARYGDRCAMFFDGKIVTTNAPRSFFSGNSFYTTAANRMSRHIFENAVNVDDIVELVRENLGGCNGHNGVSDDDSPIEMRSQKTIEPLKIQRIEESPIDDKSRNAEPEISCEYIESKRSHKAIFDAAMLLAAVLTIWVGFFKLQGDHYLAVCILLIIYAMVPFFVSFEQRRPKAREIVILAVLIAVAVVGRAACFMLPNFSPMLAIVVISAVALGKESGFLLGAISVLVSNFLFGQGPWTPWQMIAMAIVGYLAGLIFHKHANKVNKYVLIVFGAVATFFIYSGIVDIWSIFFMMPEVSWKNALIVYGAAVPMNLMHTASTVIFIFILGKPILGKLERVKEKYGMDVYSA
ncbi:MAG: ATP-binding cassette domain-containing protein [Firmicutes bacterium]|nr:ATP-binding cassette domain-containing protein [Bacillota bacterium]